MAIMTMVTVRMVIVTMEMVTMVTVTMVIVTMEMVTMVTMTNEEILYRVCRLKFDCEAIMK